METKVTYRTFLIGVSVGMLCFLLSHYAVSLTLVHTSNWRNALKVSRESLAKTQDPYQRFVLLTKAQKYAFESKEYELAHSYATEVLALAAQFPKDWNYGNAVHDGHAVLGRLDLIHGDSSAACQELLLAGNTPGSPQLDSFGPNMSLAKDLLSAGQRDAVYQYFDECRGFWHHDGGKLSRWRFLAKLHIPPDFGTSLLY